MIRRRLGAVGAVYLSRACAATPSSGHAERAMRSLRARITSAGGSAVLLRMRAIAGEEELTAAFSAVYAADSLC
jgi:hypothetical protein